MSVSTTLHSNDYDDDAVGSNAEARDELLVELAQEKPSDARMDSASLTAFGQEAEADVEDAQPQYYAQQEAHVDGDDHDAGDDDASGA